MSAECVLCCMNESCFMQIRHVLCIRTGISTACVLGLPKTYAHTSLLFPTHTCLLFHVFSLLYPHTFASTQLFSFTPKSSHMQINKCDHVKHIHKHNYVSKKQNRQTMVSLPHGVPAHVLPVLHSFQKSRQGYRPGFVFACTKYFVS